MTHFSYPTAFLPPVITTHPATAAAVSSITATIPLPFSSQLISTTASSVDVGSTQVFEAVAPDTSLLIGFGSVVVLCIAAGWVWANEVVPVSRAKLAISKNRGEVKEYLEGLKTYDDTSLDDIDATTMESAEPSMEGRVENVKPNVGDGRDIERWLFSDWLNKPSGKGGRQKEPALPILKDAKWNSGDNPVLVTAAIMMLGVVIASVTERIAH
mmetsp:Transcript_29139/g.61966  ORF Transcript_29139/g.61966 Transcript_29139/m.61966 type:complete len:213 (-) Transcript_29139:95-733(-)|eukprot:CAMPEP_0172317584 /NCGR_PEP_ID=MMETSP1058-20130122/32084_1 /TAXON_ID=83371 /ORGANISM="Detonula confervacea, Strain CCMP 353" /LENGTH=212 /DNA_ID=CAMNT_0013032181 /DNA_START=165 /DNA_END=803 /DNA_ORIENTATION=-